MDKQTPEVVDEAPEMTPQMQALLESVREANGAMQLANDAPAVEIEVDGKKVKHLNIRLSSKETLRVMSLPSEARSAMATHILKERKLASQLRRDDARATAGVKRKTKTKRKAQAKARRRNR